MEKVTVIDLGMNGEGIARIDNKVVFIPFALPDEEIEISLSKDKGKFSTGKLEKVITASKNRVEPPCPYFQHCGGCNLQHLQYDQQLKFKTSLVKNTLQKVGQINCEVLPCIASDMPYNYRNKGAFPISIGVGMFTSNSHNVVDINYCYLMNENINKCLQLVKQWINQYKIKTFNFQTRKGLLKYLVVRSVKQQTLVCLVCTDYNIPHLQELSEVLKSLGEYGLALNKNNQNNSIILGKEFKYISGTTSIKLNEFDIKYSIDIASFMQVNNDIKLKMYKDILDNVGGGVVIDAYAGAGLLSAVVASKADKVISVEIVPQASDKARQLVKQNNIKNVEVINGDCTKIIPNLTKDVKEYTVILDPAHVGCSEQVISAVKSASKIIYIACNPIALCKDLKELTKTHNIVKIQPYDMFPQTKHIETLAVLQLKQN